MTARFLIGDVFDRLAQLEDGSVDLVLTSPPFLALRSYLPADHPDKGKEIGSEPTPAAFLDTLLALTAEWRRVLAPHGSICVELGDTYSGSGGAGGDYNPDGLRDGQEKFDGSSKRAHGTDPMRKHSDDLFHQKSNGRWRTTDAGTGGKAGWPMDKSLCGIPHLYHLSLAYGRNLLTGEPSPAGQWRVRNVVAWCRPNPPVGALGDKFRPATSYMTIATVARDRYFDLDAVRFPADPANKRPSALKREGIGGRSDQVCNPIGEDGQRIIANAAGAPPLDWWEIPTQPYAGSHYATWPMALCERPIKAMCPMHVCTVCGEPSRRIVDVERHGAQENTAGRNGRKVADLERVATTLGWTDCGHGSYACSSCGVLVPSDYAVRRPGEGQGSQAPVGGEAVLVEPIEGEGESADDAGNVRDVRRGVPGPARSEVLHEELFCEAGSPGGPTAVDPAPDSYAGAEGEPSGLRPSVGAGGHAGTASERLHDGASAGDAGAPRPPARAVGDRPPSQRREGRQPAGEPGSGDEGEARRDGGLPALSGDVPGQLAEGYVCHCGSREIKYVADHWRTGIVLDPFAGSGTTLAVATGHGRDCIGIDIDERNAELARERVGMFLEVEYPEAAA